MGHSIKKKQLGKTAKFYGAQSWYNLGVFLLKFENEKKANINKINTYLVKDFYHLKKPEL